MLSTKNLSFPKSSSKKLLPKYVGPFKVIEMINRVAMKLDLPSNIGLHPVVHTSYLKPWVSGTKWDREPPDPGLDVVEIPPLQEKRVASILKDKVIKGSSETRYLVNWKDVPIYDATWHTKKEILRIDPNAIDVIQKYDKVMHALSHDYMPGGVDTHLDTFSSSDEDDD
jgi:Chromo (CHRromatin Organisation MOdifier) domain